LSRLSSAAMPFILLPLLHHAGAGALFAVVAAALVIVALDIGLLGPRTTGRALEAVNTAPAGLAMKTDPSPAAATRMGR